MSETVEGTIRLYLNIAVTAEELRSWSPDRITAFLAGIGHILAIQRAGDLLGECEAILRTLQREHDELARAEAVALKPDSPTEEPAP